MRLQTANGLSNPLVFHVGQLPEVSEKAASPVDGIRNRASARKNQLARNEASQKVDISLPTVLNGQITPGDVDSYRFAARRGQQLVAVVHARRLIPYLADAVPGWFQATLGLRDADGQQLARVDDFHHDPDPVLHYEIPDDGEYVLEIYDAIYRGREDFVYRITVGEVPFVTDVFPRGVPAGEQTPITLRGWNLPESTVLLDARNRPPGSDFLCVRPHDWITDLPPVVVEAMPNGMEREPNNDFQNAHAVELPMVLHGRVQQPGDVDVFSFTGRQGTEVIVDVQARQLKSPLDSLVQLSDAAGHRLAWNDDQEDLGAGLVTHHADSYLSVRLPHNGQYCVQLKDAQHRGGPEYSYRLRISAPQPDFALRLVPSTINAAAGATVVLTAHALRRDGFSGDILLALKDAPQGFALKGGRIPGNQSKIRLTLTVPDSPAGEVVTLQVQGTAEIAGQTITRMAIPSDELTQAFAYTHLVPMQELKAMITRGRARRIGLHPVGQLPIRIPAGGTAKLAFQATRGSYRANVQLALAEPPAGISVGKISFDRPTLTVELQSHAESVQPGLQGNLIFTASARRNSGGRPANRRTPSTTLPAIPFEILQP